MNAQKRKYTTPCLAGLSGKVWPKSAKPLPTMIRDMQRIADNSAQLPIDGVTSAEVKEWLHHFTKGVLHAYRTHGTLFKRFEIRRDLPTSNGGRLDRIVCYCPQKDTVYLTCGFIAQEIKTARGKGAVLGNANTKGQNVFTGVQLAFLLGFEETYHCRQYKKLGHLYTKSDWGMQGYDDASRKKYYADNKVEKDASNAIMNAAGRLGLTNVFPDKGKIPLCTPKPFILSR